MRSWAADGSIKLSGMKKLAAALVLTVVFGVGATSMVGAQAFSTWVAFRSPEGRYNVNFPAYPRLFAQEATAKTGEKFPQYIASSTDADTQAAYFAAYFDMTPTQTYTLTDGRDGMAKAVNGTVVGETKITLDGYDGLDVTLALTSGGADFYGRARFYQIDRRIYIVQAVIPKTAMTASVDKVAKFFESFKVTKTPY
jgi:hypothetical protein